MREPTSEYAKGQAALDCLPLGLLRAEMVSARDLYKEVTQQLKRGEKDSGVATELRTKGLNASLRIETAGLALINRLAGDVAYLREEQKSDRAERDKLIL